MATARAQLVLGLLLVARLDCVQALLGSSAGSIPAGLEAAAAQAAEWRAANIAAGDAARTAYKGLQATAAASVAGRAGASRALRQFADPLNPENISGPVRLNTSSIGNHFDSEWEIGWPGTASTCNGFLLYTITSWNDMPLTRGAPGPYAIVLPVDMSFVPYFSWSMNLGIGVFPPGIVVPVFFLGYYMGPGMASTFGVGLSCPGRCPCARIPAPPQYVGRSGAMPAKDQGASAANPVPLPTDLTFSTSRSDPPADGNFDFSWIDAEGMCNGALVYDIQNENDMAIDSTIATKWTVCLPSGLEWSDPASWGFKSNATVGDTGCTPVSSIGFYMAPVEEIGATAKSAFALTLRCDNNTYFEIAGGNNRACGCPGVGAVLIQANGIAAAATAFSSTAGSTGTMYQQALAELMDGGYLRSPAPNPMTTAYDNQEYAKQGLTWSPNGTSDFCAMGTNVKCFSPSSGQTVFKVNVVSAVTWTMPPGTTAFLVEFTSSSPAADQGRPWDVIVLTESGVVQRFSGGGGDGAPAVVEGGVKYYGWPLLVKTTGGEAIKTVKLAWADNVSRGFWFSNIYLSFVSPT